jgi:hypothetical protein
VWLRSPGSQVDQEVSAAGEAVQAQGIARS